MAPPPDLNPWVWKAEYIFKDQKGSYFAPRPSSLIHVEFKLLLEMSAFKRKGVLLTRLPVCCPFFLLRQGLTG